ncbi:MAG TPA: hypothetical protein VHB02_03095 [Acidimicrobiales bacterium]|nr:hypothetical protein [Acidimicrobiales bacterium]
MTLARDGRPTIVEPGRGTKRELLIATFIERVATVGFRRTRVDDVCRQAGVSIREWYEWFGKKDPTYLLVFGTLGGALLRKARTAFEEEGGPWERRVRAGLEVVTAELAGKPVLTRFLMECPHVDGGDAALARLLGRAHRVYLTDEIRGRAPAVPPAALESIATSLVVQPMMRYVEEGQLHRLPELVPWIVYYLTLDLLGPERAAPLLPGRGSPAGQD